MVFDLWDDVEHEAAELGWKPGLPGSAVREVIENARLQKGEPGPAPRELLEALVYYHQHDAFIDFLK